MGKTERFIINGKSYQAKEIDFNFICRLEAEGIEMSRMGKSFMNVIKIYAAYCMDVDADIAGEELNNHLINGGTFEELIDLVSAKMDESDFFRAVSKKQEQENAKTSKKTSKKDQAASE